MSLRVLISPSFPNVDNGDGGIRRVVEAQCKYLPKFDVEVVARETDADLVAVHAASYVGTNKPFVAHNHGLYWTPEYEWGSWAHEMNGACVNVLRRADAVTAPSDWVGRILARGMNLPAQTVYHGVDADEWQPGPKDHTYVLWNKSRVDAVCDPEPVSIVAGLLRDVDFVSTFANNIRGDNMRVIGRLSYEQGKSLVQNASVYLATARETFGIGTLEAMAAGAVVVGYDWGGQAEIIEHGVNGLLCSPGDTKMLAVLVRQALQDREVLAEAARATVLEYTWERACEQYAQVYRAVMERVPPVRVSVVITCYNLAQSLPRAVASVDMADAEIVVVDDASPDDTAAVASSLAAGDPRIRIVTNKSNLYLASSLNAGIQASTGKYIVPLDADNELASGALAVLASNLDSNPDVDIAYGAMRVEQEWAGGGTFVSGWPEDFVYERQMAHRNQVPSTAMYRRKWWERSGGYRRRCRTAEDADFWCRITSLGAQPKKVTQQVTLVYHERKESMSHVEADWPWNAWYTWSRVPGLTPFGAPAALRKVVPTYEPALVTVVIPAGPGHAKYLPDALDSLVAQTYVNWRCVVVYNSPPDEWRTLPPWAPALTFDSAIGPARARNAGLEHVETPWVLFLDADDYLAPNALEVLVRAARERDSLGKEWFYSDWYKQEEGKVYKAPDFVAEHLRTHLTHSVTAMYPVAALRAVGGFDESLDAWEDWDLVLKLVEAGLCGVHLPFPLFYYRYQAGQRREQLYAQRERHTEVMKNKWRHLMVEMKPMACGCQGGVTVYAPPVNMNGTPIPVSKDGRTLVEFIGRSAPRTYRGPSGAEYRFGSDSGHALKHVANEDLSLFINRHDFRLAVADADGFAVLDALGPPNRMAEFAQPPVLV